MFVVAGRFARAEPRRTARDMVLGLLSPVERKNCWWLAEQAGHGDPQSMQRLLRTAVWDADAVRDDLRAFVAAQLGHPAGVLIPDETGFLRKARARWVCRASAPIARTACGQAATLLKLLRRSGPPL